MSKFLDCYYRVSTKGQKDEGHSLESQIQLSKIVAKQLGLEIREHNEFAKSSTIKGVIRDKFEEIKTLIEQDKIKNLWVVEQERLFRKPSDAFFFKEYYLDEFKVTLYSGENPQPQQFGSEFDNEMFQFRALISGFESKKIRRRSIRGKRHLLDNYSNEKSIYLGGTPTFGYDNKDKTWVINPEESKWIKWMFKSYADGLSSLNIKKELDLNNIKPRRTRSGLWNVGTIQNMLGNESFTGIKRFYDKELKDCLEFVSEGDELVITRVDRLARSILDLQLIIKELEKKGATLSATEQPISTKDATSKCFLDMLSVFSEFETNLRKERQMEGIAKAKEKGVYKGRKPTVDVEKIRELAKQGLQKTAIAKELGIGRATVYRALEV